MKQYIMIIIIIINVYTHTMGLICLLVMTFKGQAHMHVQYGEVSIHPNIKLNSNMYQ